MEPDQTPHELEETKQVEGIDPAACTEGIALAETNGGAAVPTANSVAADNLIHDPLAGEFNKPVRIVVFNMAEGWCRDVTVNITDELTEGSVLQFLDTSRR
jgi:hypothetical protein